MRISLVKKASIFGIIVLFVGSGGASALYDKQPVIADSMDFGDVLWVDDNSPCPGNGTPEWPYCKIQYAIDNASAEYIIMVAPGRYYEHLIIWPYLNSLKIERWNITDPNVKDPMLIGNGTGTGITIQASNVIIEALTITNYGQQSRDAGIYVEWNPSMQTANVRIQNCNISDVYNGISMKRENGTGYIETAHSIHGNYIHNSMIGIHLFCNNKCIVERNIIKTEKTGIIIEGNVTNTVPGLFQLSKSNNLIRYNEIIHDSAYGVVLLYSIGNIFENNKFISISPFFSPTHITFVNGLRNYWMHNDFKPELSIVRGYLHIRCLMFPISIRYYSIPLQPPFP